MKEIGSVMKAVDILEEAIRAMDIKKNDYQEKYNATCVHRFLNYVEIVEDDIKIIRDLELKYGLVSDNQMVQEEVER